MRLPQRTRPVFVPPGGPPPVERPSGEILTAMEEPGVFGLLEDVYLLLGKSEIASLFPDDLLGASRRSAAFFVQLLGGRPLFSELYGPPRMRQRHLPFEIDDEARAVWLSCFESALDSAPERHGFPAEHLEGFLAFLHGFSTWMVNAR